MTPPTPTLPSTGGLKNPAWRYVAAEATDIRARFDAIRNAKAQAAAVNVKPIKNARSK